MTISTRVWSVQHPNAGRNIQHTGQIRTKFMVEGPKFTFFRPWLYLEYLVTLIALSSMKLFFGPKVKLRHWDVASLKID